MSEHVLLDLVPYVTILVTLVLWETGKAFLRRYRERVEAETLPQEHLGLRKRAYQNVWRDLSTWEAVQKCEHSRGWMWVRVKGHSPRRGLMPIECHHEDMGWALTRRGARRQLRRRRPLQALPPTPPAQPMRPSPRR
jgi:hypothetical protein